MSEGPVADQRQGRRARKQSNKWRRHLLNMRTVRMFISLGRLVVEIYRIFQS